MEKSPARIFVLWHPEFEVGQKIGEGIFEWFRTPDGHGIPVYYRSKPDPRRQDGLPPKIPFDRASFNLLIILAEAKMVRDRVWRDWLSDLADRSTANSSVLFPVALHRTAYKLPGSIRSLNFISPHVDSGRGTELLDEDFSILLDKLRKSLTEVFARCLSEEFLTPGLMKFAKKIVSAFTRHAGEPPKIKVFVSHAKRDGTNIAKQLRDYIYQETQLSAFFDENDIALGYKFANVLDRTLESETAAMIVVNSDHYASRPWCRREIQVFSRPKQSRIYKGVWEKPPVLIVQSMNGGIASNAIPEFGNSPVLQWRDEDEALCIDTLLREAIFRTYHSTLAGMIKTELQKYQADQNRVFINWAPDPLALETVIQEWEKEKLEEHKKKHQQKNKRRIAQPTLRPLEVIYPGRGLTAIELQTLNERLPGVTLRSFNEARPVL